MKGDRSFMVNISPPQQNALKQMGESSLGPTWRVEDEVLSDVDECRA